MSMKLYVEAMNGYIHTIYCEPSDTIGRLKGKIQEDCGLTPDEQILIFGENELEDGYSLSDYNIDAEDTLQ